MSIHDLNPRYKYYLLYLYKGGDPLKLSARYGIPLPLLRELYRNYEDLIKDLDNRIKLVEDLLAAGFSEEEICEVITWSDFEYLIERFLQANGFNTHRNYQLKKPRGEIDIIAYKGMILFCIECKNWDRVITPKKLDEIISHHIEKCYRLKSEDVFSNYKIYPIVVTLRSVKEYVYKGVLVLPIKGLKNFLEVYHTLIFKKVIREVSELKSR